MSEINRLQEAASALFAEKIWQAPRAPLEKKESVKKNGTSKGRFLRSPEWKAVRERVFARDGRKCCKCGSEDQLNIDHIIPMAKVAELALDDINLRVLCWPCNRTKAARVEVDWTP